MNHGIYNSDDIKRVEWVEYSDLLPSMEEIINAEKEIGIKIPEIIKQWIKDFGILSSEPDLFNDPFIILLGIAQDSSMWSDIIYFNYPNNPSRPDDFLVFAHEFDGFDDIIYAVDKEGSIHAVTNGFAMECFKNKYNYKNVKWIFFFSSLSDFWLNIVQLKYIDIEEKILRYKN